MNRSAQTVRPTASSATPYQPNTTPESGASVPKRLQDEAFEYVSQWCKASQEFVSRKVPRWKLLEDLYHNRRGLNSWSSGSELSAVESRGAQARTPSSSERWQADIVLTPSYIVDSWADRAYQAVFNGPDWLSVAADVAPGPPAGEHDFPASYKLQELLLSKLGQGQINIRLYEILQHLVLYGSVYAKVFWYSKDVTRQRWNDRTLELVQDHGKVFDCPVVQVIPLDKVLVDWTATHNDVQRHTGIGHKADTTFNYLDEQFKRGVYDLNRADFLRRWEGSSRGSSPMASELLRDRDTDDLMADDVAKLTIWEWHGRVPTKEGFKECVCTIVTDRGDDSPENGVMIRLLDAPVLWSGLRPFVAAHYTPLPGPFGMGAVESNLDLIHSISQFISQSQDNARLTANAQLIVRRGSSAARQISTESNAVYPGKIWLVDDPGDIQPFPVLSFPQQEINSLVSYLNNLLEKRTSVSDITLGVAGRAKTATEAHLLSESAGSAFATRVDLFARTFLEPLGKLGLSLVQQFLLEDQLVMIQDINGQDRPLVVRAQEIQSGRYKVVATITRQDSTRIAKAQSIERALPTLAKFQPVLSSEGYRISFAELFKRYLDLIGVEGADRVLKRVEQGVAQPGGAQSEQGSAGGAGSDGAAVSAGSGYWASHYGDGSRKPAAPDTPARLLEHGGPMGPQPTDLNALAQFLQVQAAKGQ
ncbi:MAG: hypothetical protein AB1646_15505 [Thermodesulfobacteriota bacterium]